VTAHDSVSVSTVVAVAPATAFAVFTEDIARWWRPKAPRLFSPDRDWVLQFDSGRMIVAYEIGDPFVIGRVLVWEPGRRLVFEWRQTGYAPSERTEVEVRFDPVARGTRVTVGGRMNSTPPQR
jgi:uncharacterized protein YndB with AHSA1/START domain